MERIASDGAILFMYIGEYIRCSLVNYQLNDADEIRDDRTWQKSMPMLGITTEKESIHRDIESSKNDPAKQDELMAKTFNLPVNNYLSYFTNSEVYGNREKFDADMFVGTPENNVVVSMGIDLSAVNDIWR